MSQYAEKMQNRHPPIQEHLVYSHLICMYMVVIVHTYSAYMCVQCRFPEVTILFNQHFSIVENTVGKSREGHSNPIYLVLKPPKTPKCLNEFFDCPVSSMHMVLQICRICT